MSKAEQRLNYNSGCMVVFVEMLAVVFVGCTSLYEDAKGLYEQYELVTGDDTEEVTEVSQTEAEFLAELRSKATLRTNNTPDVTDNRIEFGEGEYLAFRTQATADAWINGDSSTGLLTNPNSQLRHGIFDVGLPENEIRSLGGNSLMDYDSIPMPVVPYTDIYYWETVNGKKVYVIDGMEVYALRVANKLKGEFGINGEASGVSGNVITER